jgi:SAM-dependent methyltransferase
VTVDWCREHIPGVDFTVNGAMPPLRWQDGHFDFVMAVSVFTHIPWKMQIGWLKELRRVLRPGGYLLATTHGDFCARNFLKMRASRRTKTRDIVIFAIIRMRFSPTGINRHLSVRSMSNGSSATLFEHVVHIPRGFCNYQDAVILRRD